MKYQIAIFDWDGTLIDSVEHIAESLHRAATSLGLPAKPLAAYRNIIGLGMVEALDALYPGMSKSEMEALREAYSSYFFSRKATPQTVFPGIDRLLNALSEEGAILAVATGKSRRGLDLALASTGLGQRFRMTRCADETRSKPDPRMLHEILAETGLSPEQAVMIGDTTYDMEMAQRAGMPAVGVTWGVHDQVALAAHAPVAVVDHIEALTQVLLG